MGNKRDEHVGKPPLAFLECPRKRGLKVTGELLERLDPLNPCPCLLSDLSHQDTGFLGSLTVISFPLLLILALSRSTPSGMEKRS